MTEQRPGDASRAVSAAARRDRIEDYIELRDWGLKPQQAAERMGICARTAWRYEAEINRNRKGQRLA